MESTTTLMLANATWYSSWYVNDNQTNASDGGGGEVPEGPGWVLPAWVGTLAVLIRVRLGICYVALFCNAVVLGFQMKLQSFRKTQYYFAVILVISDILFISCTFGETYRYIHRRVPIPPFYNGLYLSSHMMGWLAVIAVGVDRYLALIKMPFTYKFKITIKKYVLVTLAMMVWSSLYAFIFTRYFQQSDTVVQYRGFIVLAASLIISTAVYVKMFFAVKKSFRAMNLGDRVQQMRLKQTRRLMFAFSLILITNAICFTPLTVVFLTIYFVHQGEGLYLPKNLIILNVILNLRALNSILNPIIYWWQVIFREISLPCRSTKEDSSDSSTKMSTISKTN